MQRRDSLKNLLFGLISFLVTTALGVLVPKLILDAYQSEVNGLISSVRQFYSYFLLLEAGVGGAALQAMYAPMSRQDRKALSGILSATAQFYRRTGLFYVLGVVLLSVLYPLLVDSELDKRLIFWIVAFQGAAGCARYFVMAKLQILLKVDNRTYVLSNLTTVFSVLSNLARIILILRGRSILLVQGAFCLIDACQVIAAVVYVRRRYPWIDWHATPDHQAISQKSAVLVHQISSLVFSNTDTLILTFACGLKTVSVYAMYSLFYGLVASVIDVCSNSVSAVLGQLFHRDKERFCQVQAVYETVFLAICFALFTLTYLFILPVLQLYTAGVTDISYIDPYLPALFTCMQVLNYGRITSNNLINFAGHFRQTQGRAIGEMTINLAVSLICVGLFGIYGVLFGTIAALLYRTNDFIVYANRVILGRSPWPTYRRWLLNAALMVLCIVLGSRLPIRAESYLHLLGWMLPCALAVGGIFLLGNLLLEYRAIRQFFLEWRKK